MWLGTLLLWSERDARRENERRGALLDPDLRDRLFLIGTNTAGLLFGIDEGGAVVVMDECEMDYPQELAGDFEAFRSSFVVAPDDQKALRKKEQADGLRRMPARWRKLDALIEADDARSRAADVHAILVDIADEHRLAGKLDVFLEALRAFVQRHPGRRGLAAKIRKYATR